MILCVGAASRRVVEEAAKLHVHQIVASRRQVAEFSPGYTGYDSETFVDAVVRLSGGVTMTVRDHGGPHQNGDKADDWTAAFDADVAAGFDVLHIDVCKLRRADQPAELRRLCRRYAQKPVEIEVGGERDPQVVLNSLLSVALEECEPYAAVADLGGHIWADRQCGGLIPAGKARELLEKYAAEHVRIKAHNMDWIGGRQHYVQGMLYNVAPEFGNVEVDAWMRVLKPRHAKELLNFAYGTGSWKRWFDDASPGTTFERARAALRYHLEHPEVTRILNQYDDTDVRKAIRDAITAG